jgi:N-acetyl-alpha-D-muramate 1-phosphate uridylyltransferase
MKAMVFAAGMGTRLRPLTEKTPKALVKVNGQTVLERVLVKLNDSGFNDVIINIHHHAEKVKNFINEKTFTGMKICYSDESDLLLDTGGGLKKAAWFFNDQKPFLVHNVDVLSDINLAKAFHSHLEKKPLATLVVHKRETDRLLLFDHHMHLSGWKNAKTGTIKNPGGKSGLLEFGFSGIHIIEPSIFNLMNRNGVFSIIDVYLELLKSNTINGYEVTGHRWMDIGSLDDLNAAERYYRANSL